MEGPLFSRWSRELAGEEPSSVRLPHVLFLLSCVLLTYAPVIVGTYAFLDDYRYLQGEPGHFH